MNYATYAFLFLAVLSFGANAISQTPREAQQRILMQQAASQASGSSAAAQRQTAHAGGQRSGDDFRAVFATPELNGMRVGYCMSFGEQCGLPAATYFCKQAGFRSAGNSSSASGVASATSPVYLMGDKNTCRDAGCKALRDVECLGYGKNYRHEKFFDTREACSSNNLTLATPNGRVKLSKKQQAQFFMEPIKGDRHPELVWYCDGTKEWTRLPRPGTLSQLKNVDIAQGKPLLVKVRRSDGRRFWLEFYSSGVIPGTSPDAPVATASQPRRAERPTTEEQRAASTKVMVDAMKKQGANPYLATAVADNKRCYNSVQGKIAWNYEGNTAWQDGNVNKLCAGAEKSDQPAVCFKEIMHSGVNWGGGTQWSWANAINLCKGTSNARASVICFKSAISEGKAWGEAISLCRTR
jgi:hypothetical protein